MEPHEKRPAGPVEPPEAVGDLSRGDEGPPYAAARRILPPAIIVTLALVLRILFTLQVAKSPVPDLSRVRDVAADPSGIARQVHNDGTDMEAYDYIARWILRHGWLEKSAEASPLYPYAFLPLAYMATASNVTATTIIQAFFSSATVLVGYILAMKLYGRRPAVYAGLVGAVYAPFIVYQEHLLGEFLLNLVVAGLFVVLVGCRARMSVKRALAAGALFGLAMLAKPTTLVFAPLALVWMLARASWKIRQVILPALVAAATALVVIVPFSLRNYYATGNLILIRGNSGKMLYMGNNPAATGAYGEPRGPEAEALAAETLELPLREKDRVYTRAALRFVREHPKAWLGLLRRKFRFFFGAEEISNNLSMKLFRQTTFVRSFPGFGFVMPLALAGFLFSLRRRGVWFVAAEAVVYSAAIIAIVVVGRYRLAIVPLVLPAAGFALAEMIVAFKEMRFARTAGILAVTLAAAVAVNWIPLRLYATEKLHPSGFRSVTRSAVTYHDDSNYPTIYTGNLSAEGRIRKIIFASEVPADARNAVVAIYMSVARAGQLTVTLNDVPLRIPLDESPPGWRKIAFPSDVAVEGANTIDLDGDGRLEAFVFADDVYRFHRSFYNPKGSLWLRRNLDFLSYRRIPSLHMGGNEFKIRLEMLTPEAPPAGG